MRSLLALSAVALFIFAQPTLAATACDPHAPLNGAFCAGELCSTIGITTYDHDGTTPIACAYDPVFNRNIWKPMSASVGLVGGGSYTAFGTTSCDVFGGYHVSYTGTVVYPVAGYLNHALAIGSVFCSAVAIPAGSSGTGQFSNTVDEAKMVLPCAVCVK